MSEEEGSFDANVTAEATPGGGEDGPLPPCCSWILGLACLVAAVGGLFLNEGTYVKTLEAIERTGNAVVSVCDSGCTHCDFDKVVEWKSKRVRKLKDGDVVFMSCPLLNTQDVSVITSSTQGCSPLTFQPAALASAVKAASPAEPSARFRWSFEMFQLGYTSLEKESPDLNTFKGGIYKSKPKMYCQDKDFLRDVYTTDCTKSAPKGEWTTGGIPQPQPKPKPEPIVVDVCKGLNKQGCEAKAGACTWVWQCAKLAEAECRQHGPLECQWAAAPITTKTGKECKGCCPTDDTWRVACRPVVPASSAGLAPAGGHHGQANRSAEASWTELADGAGDEAREGFEELGELLGGGAAGAAAPRARRLKGSSKPVKVTCTFEFCKTKFEWSRELQKSPSAWPRLPLQAPRGLQHVSPPASNLPRLESKSCELDKWSRRDMAVRIGAKGRESMALDVIADEASIFPEASFVPTKLAQHSASSVLPAGLSSSKKYTHKETGSTVELVEYDRSTASEWTAQNSQTSDACGAGCLCSGTASLGLPQVGDLRLCVRQSSTRELSIIAGAVQVGGGWALTATDVLKIKGPSLNPGKGFRRVLNERQAVEEMLEGARQDADSLLKVLRIMFPLVMWLGFYCCLSPIVWVLDQFGDMVGAIPCVGGFAEGVVDFVETLAQAAICAVSCCSALACSLLVASFAWLFYRPLYGIAMLAVSLAVVAGVGFFAQNQKGAPRVRGSRRSAREVRPPSTVEMNSSLSQPPQQFQVLCPAGVTPGMQLQVQAPTGQMIMVQVPEGVAEGQAFAVQVP